MFQNKKFEVTAHRFYPVTTIDKYIFVAGYSLVTIQ